MNSGINKTAIIIAIWVMTGLISMGVSMNTIEAGLELGLGFTVPIIIALVATLFIGRDSGQPGIISDQSAADKRKRGGDDKLSLLMELLDDEERAAFKETLMRRALAEADDPSDGELPYDAETLEALLTDNEATHVLRQ